MRVAVGQTGDSGCNVLADAESMELSEAGLAQAACAGDLVRAVTHGLANRLLVIRCHAELAAAGDGSSAKEDLASLVEQTDETSALLRELAPLARSAVDGGVAELAALSACVARLFPSDLAFQTRTAAE